MKSFWKHRKQADIEMKEGVEKHQEVARHLRLAVEALGRPGEGVPKQCYIFVPSCALATKLYHAAAFPACLQFLEVIGEVK